MAKEPEWALETDGTQFERENYDLITSLFPSYVEAWEHYIGLAISSDERRLVPAQLNIPRHVVDECLQVGRRLSFAMHHIHLLETLIALSRIAPTLPSRGIPTDKHIQLITLEASILELVSRARNMLIGCIKDIGAHFGEGGIPEKADIPEFEELEEVIWWRDKNHHRARIWMQPSEEGLMQYCIRVPREEVEKDSGYKWAETVSDFRNTKNMVQIDAVEMLKKAVDVALSIPTIHKQTVLVKIQGLRSRGVRLEPKSLVWGHTWVVSESASDMRFESARSVSERELDEILRTLSPLS